MLLSPGTGTEPWGYQRNRIDRTLVRSSVPVQRADSLSHRSSRSVALTFIASAASIRSSRFWVSIALALPTSETAWLGAWLTDCSASAGDTIGIRNALTERHITALLDQDVRTSFTLYRRLGCVPWCGKCVSETLSIAAESLLRAHRSSSINRVNLGYQGAADYLLASLSQAGPERALRWTASYPGTSWKSYP
jgi:bacterioferritin-associated ferredoxin